ncbi:hypothetical protein Bbelb_348450 [Branchiostoma belcheri]|nr:hypothetical protein Bbelb_348450 [Branchiostoma belcheri]
MSPHLGDFLGWFSEVYYCIDPAAALPKTRALLRWDVIPALLGREEHISNFPRPLNTTPDDPGHCLFGADGNLRVDFRLRPSSDHGIIISASSTGINRQKPVHTSGTPLVITGARFIWLSHGACSGPRLTKPQEGDEDLSRKCVFLRVECVSGCLLRPQRGAKAALQGRITLMDARTGARLALDRQNVTGRSDTAGGQADEQEEMKSPRSGRKPAPESSRAGCARCPQRRRFERRRLTHAPRMPDIPAPAARTEAFR